MDLIHSIFVFSIHNSASLCLHLWKHPSILSPFQNVTGVNAAPQEDFSELPPNQRRKKLQAKIDELTAKISQVCYQHYCVTPPLTFVIIFMCSQETAARDGLMKMKTVYEANPALGDPMSIQVRRLGINCLCLFL